MEDLRIKNYLGFTDYDHNKNPSISTQKGWVILEIHNTYFKIHFINSKDVYFLKYRQCD